MSKIKIKPTSTYNNYSTMLTAPDIVECRRSLKGVLIAPFNENQAKGIGYNISPSDLFYSLKKSAPLPIRHNDEGSYVYIKPHDTVLVLSYEYIQSDINISGTFHSKVRSSAAGLGNVSTTLDPGWKGMLLISINNPTNRKIKIQIIRKKDGKDERCSLITMVVFRNGGLDNRVGNLSFHLDNPPMRADVWSELVSRPNRFWHNKRYNQFQKFIQKLIDFKSDASKRANDYNDILNLVINLKIAVDVEKSNEKANAIMIQLNTKIKSDDLQLRKKFDSLKKQIIISQHSHKNIDSFIEALSKECEYLILCDEVEQIHQYISDSVDAWWEHGLVLRIVYNHLLPNLGSIFATILLLIVLLNGSILPQDSFYYKIVLAFSPTLFSFLLNKLLKNKNNSC